MKAAAVVLCFGVIIAGAFLIHPGLGVAAVGWLALQFVVQI